MDNVRIEDVLRLQDFGLERLDEDRAIVGFAARSEARIARWLDFAKGALLLLMVPDDPESGSAAAESMTRSFLEDCSRCRIQNW